jgi:hypothetical protein
MADRTYWLDLFTGTTWQEFLDAGAETSGFRESRWKTVQRIKPGDYLLCYLTGVSRWIGVLEVRVPAFKDSSPIWKDEEFPCRLKVKVVASLTPETAVPVFELRDQLSAFQDLKSPHAWTGKFRGSPARWKKSDGEAVVQAVLEAKESPVIRPVDKAKLRRRPITFKAKIGSVTVPEAEEEVAPEERIPTEVTPHTEIQWLLLKLGGEMGLDVWVLGMTVVERSGGTDSQTSPAWLMSCHSNSTMRRHALLN